MAKYRPVDLKLWNDRKFLSLSQDGRMLWLFLLTAPCTLPIPGVIIAGEGTIADQLEWSPERFRDRFAELLGKGLSVRSQGRLIWLANALRYQPPANPNVIAGWAKYWDDVPEVDLKHDLWQAMKVACKSWERTFTKLFAEPHRNGLGNGSPNGSANGFIQDQDQDQDQDQERSQPSLPAKLPDPNVEDLERRARQDLRGEIWRRLAEARQALAAELGIEARPLHPQDPGERALSARILEGATRADCEHVLAVVEAEARATRSVQWLTGGVFEERPWRRALGMSVADAERPRGPQRGGADPSPRRPLKTL